MARTSRKAASLGVVALALVAVLGEMRAGAALHSTYVLTLPQAETAGYVLPAITALRGQPLTYVNLDPVPHTVTSLEVTTKTIKVGKKVIKTKVPLFDSRVVAGMTTANVPNVATLPVGTYHFICTLHPRMKGTLTVR